MQAGLVEDDYEFNSINLTGHGDLDILGNDSTLTVTSGNALIGDSYLSDLTVYGTLIGPSIVEISGVDIGVQGDIQLGSESITLGSDVLGGGMTLYANTWAHDSDNQYSFGSLTLKSSSSLTLESYDDEDTEYIDDYGVTLSLTDLTIGSNSTLTASETGYSQEEDYERYLGHGGGDNSGEGEGGNYGGYGEDNTVGSIYGDIYQPTYLGSSGGGNPGTFNGYGGPGGGTIKLIISDTLDNNGTITSNGGKSSGDINAELCGAGSGGSIWIETDILDGSGIISANGNTLQDDDTEANDGSGGRVALYYKTNSGFNLDVDHIQARGNNAGPGTIYVENYSTSPDYQGGNLYIDNNSELITYGADFEAQDYTFNDIYIGSNVQLLMKGNTEQNRGVTFEMTGDFTLEEGANLYGVEQGFSSGLGSGAGSQGVGNCGGGGGGHGGVGGEGQDDGVNDETPGGSSYDSSIQPTYLGSAGGISGTGAAGGTGGGTVSIITDTGNVIINGEINVSGSDGEVTGDSSGGGGAGGSIYIKACDINVSSTGVIKAEGGNADIGDPTYKGGGGGGGIIVLAHTCTDTITIDPASTISRTEGTGFHAGGEGIYGAYGIPQIYLQKQYKITDIELPVGGEISEKAIKFKFNVADPDATATLTPQIEIQVAGENESFDLTNIIQGSSVEWTGGDPVQLEIDVTANNGEATLQGKGNPRSNILGITSDDLTYGEDYKWRGRVADETGMVSDWVDFGSNNDGVDFQITPEGDGGDDDDTGTCGNGTIETSNNEQCDSTQLGGLSCTDFDSFIGGNLACSSDCTYDTSDCYGSVPVCGNGIVEVGEQCDGGIGDALCTDFSFTGGTLSCSDTCTFDTNQCTSDSQDGDIPAVCGNGIVEVGEQCDNDIGDSTCQDFDDFTGGTLICNNECQLDTSNCIKDPECGNGIVEPGEQCDGDTGDLTCKSFFGYINGELICNESCEYDLSSCTRGTSESIINLPVTGSMKNVITIALDTLSIILAIISILLAFPSILVKREKKPWGLVYDKNTKRPVAFAVVRLFSKKNKLIAQKVTDLEGRYGFAVGEGEYKLKVNHDSYKEYEIKLEIDKKSKGTLNRDVELTAVRDVKFNFMRWIKSQLAKAKEIFPKLSKYMYIFGFAFAIFAILINPVIYNLIIIAFYVLLAIFYFVFGVKRGWGKVYNSTSKESIGYAAVRLFDVKENKLIDNQMTDEKGRYMFITKKGEYNLLASKKGYTFPSKNVDKKKVRKTFYGSLIKAELSKEKVLGVDLAMDPVSKKESDLVRLEGKKVQGETKFGSPFS